MKDLQGKDQVIIVAALLWSLGLPYFPDAAIQILDTLFGAFILLLVSVLTLSYGPVPGVLTLCAVALTFVERNRRKIKTYILNEQPSLDQQLAPAPPQSADETHPQFDTPTEEDIPFVPKEDATDEFEDVGFSSIDEKHVIPTVNPGGADHNTNAYNS
jgi:hypothetical protein